MSDRARWWSGVVVALLIGLVGGLFIGRFLGPEKTTERATLTESAKVAEALKVAIDVKKVAAKVERRVVYRDRIIYRDGGERIIEVEKTGTEENTTEDRREARVQIQTVEVEKRVEVEKVITRRADWRVGVLAGASLREPLVPIAGPLVLGATFERRIIGGLSAGLWLNTSGAAGAIVSLEF